MKNTIEQLLLKNGASMVGIGRIEGLYNKVELDVPRSEDSQTELFEIPEYPVGISILLAYPKSVIRNISEAPTMEYFDAYHELNNKLDKLAILCTEYIESQGFHAYPQTVSSVKEYGMFRTIMPHKTVAISAGLGWIGKSTLFLTEEFGSALRLTSVLTDAPLECNEPVKASKCGNCSLCEKACPGHAISGRLWKPELDREDYFDAVACRKKAREIAANSINKKITLCGKCIEVCPYTRKYTRE